MNKHAETVRAGYAVIAKTYHGRRLAKEQINFDWFDGLRQFLPSAGSVVDLGCGGGVPVSRYFARRGYEVTGYDISEEMLAIARAEVPEGQFFHAAMEGLRLEPGSADIIVSFFAIIHVERSLHAQLFARMFEWLKPGGVVFLSLGAEDNPAQRDPDWHGAPMEWSHFDAKTNLELLKQAGFEVAWHEVEDLGNEKHLFVIATRPPG